MDRDSCERQCQRKIIGLHQKEERKINHRKFGGLFFLAIPSHWVP